MGNEKTHFAAVLLGAILLIAICLRLYGIDFGRPYNYHPDETKLVTQAGRLLATKFMDKDDAPSKQKGNITYEFRLKDKN